MELPSKVRVSEGPGSSPPGTTWGLGCRCASRPGALTKTSTTPGARVMVSGRMPWRARRRRRAVPHGFVVVSWSFLLWGTVRACQAMPVLPRAAPSGVTAADAAATGTKRIGVSPERPPSRVGARHPDAPATRPPAIRSGPLQAARRAPGTGTPTAVAGSPPCRRWAAAGLLTGGRRGGKGPLALSTRPWWRQPACEVVLNRREQR